MRKLLLLGALAGPAFAEGGITVTLPDPAAIDAASETGLMMELAQAEVVGMTCPGFRLTAGEAALISGTVDLLADRYDLNPEYRALNIYGPARTAMDQPDTCAKVGPTIKPLLDRLKAMGGSTDPSP